MQVLFSCPGWSLFLSLFFFLLIYTFPYNLTPKWKFGIPLNKKRTVEKCSSRKKKSGDKKEIVIAIVKKKKIM